MIGEFERGTVVWFDNSYGYGFILWPENPNKKHDVFVHYTQIVSYSKYKSLDKNEIVLFKPILVGTRFQANNVRRYDSTDFSGTAQAGDRLFSKQNRYKREVLNG